VTCSVLSMVCVPEHRPLCAVPCAVYPVPRRAVNALPCAFAGHCAQAIGTVGRFLETTFQWGSRLLVAFRGGR